MSVLQWRRLTPLADFGLRIINVARAERELWPRGLHRPPHDWWQVRDHGAGVGGGGTRDRHKSHHVSCHVERKLRIQLKLFIVGSLWRQCPTKMYYCPQGSWFQHVCTVKNICILRYRHVIVTFRQVGEICNPRNDVIREIGGTSGFPWQKKSAWRHESCWLLRSWKAGRRLWLRGSSLAPCLAVLDNN